MVFDYWLLFVFYCVTRVIIGWVFVISYIYIYILDILVGPWMDGWGFIGHWIGLDWSL